MELSMTNCNL